MKLLKSLFIILSVFLVVNCSKDESSVNDPIAEVKQDLNPKTNEETEGEKGDKELEQEENNSEDFNLEETNSEEPNPEISIDSVPEVYFTFSTYNNLPGTFKEGDDWILLHDKDGNLLDYSLIEAEKRLIFESAHPIKPDDFTVTIFYRRSYDNGTQHTFVSYPNVSNKSIWKYKPGTKPWIPGREDPEPIGSYNVTIKNLPEKLLRFHLSSDFGLARFRGNYVFENGTYTLNLDNIGVYPNNDYILSVVEHDTQIKYLSINDVQPGDKLSFSYNELKEYDYTIDIDLPDSMINQYYDHFGKEAISEYSGYRLDEHASGKSNMINPKVIRLGYLDRLQVYKTQIELYTDDYIYNYSKVGKPPTPIVLSKPIFTIENEQLSNFKFNTNLGFIKRSSVWGAGDLINPGGVWTTNWQVVSDKTNNPKIDGIPQELINKYPEIQLEALTHKKTYLYLRGDTYSEYINRYFLENRYLEEYESEVITIWK